MTDRTWVSCTIRVDGHPATQGSMKHVGRGRMVPSSKRLYQWRADITKQARAEWGPRQPATGPVSVRLAFTMPRPKATPKTRPTPPAVKKPDLDKLVRAVFDALTGVCWLDDSQAVQLIAAKRIAALGEEPGVFIELKEIA